MIKILSTKKISENFKKIYKENFKFFSYDFLEISFLEQKNLENIFKNSENIFIFTSQYAIKSILENKNLKEKILKNKLKAYAIEWKTSDLVKKAWFEILETWKNSLDLVEKINTKNFKLIHLTTENHLKDMQVFLEKKWIKLKTINVYEKKLSPKKIDFEFEAILFFSPSAIESFFKNNIINENIIVFCIWKITKKYFLEKKLKNKIIITEKHSEEDLLKTMQNYFKN